MAKGSNLDQISTAWTDLVRAHATPSDDATEARRMILERYDVAVFGYLCKVSGDTERARDLFQEFSLRFIRGDFRGADRERGRFRAYLKTSLLHLVSEMARKEQTQPMPLNDLAKRAAAETDELHAKDVAFAEECRAAIVDRAWELLDEESQRLGKPLMRALELRVSRSKEPSRVLAAEVSVGLDRPISANGFDKLVWQARPPALR